MAVHRAPRGGWLCPIARGGARRARLGDRPGDRAPRSGACRALPAEVLPLVCRAVGAVLRTSRAGAADGAPDGALERSGTHAVAQLIGPLRARPFTRYRVPS